MTDQQRDGTALKLNAYLVKTKDMRSYTEPILDDGTGPSFPVWPMSPVVAATPSRAKSLFLRAFTGRGSTGVETDDYPNLRVTLLEKNVDVPAGVYEHDDHFWMLAEHALRDAA